jgi:hypothetical protein
VREPEREENHVFVALDFLVVVEVFDHEERMVARVQLLPHLQEGPGPVCTHALSVRRWAGEDDANLQGAAVDGMQTYTRPSAMITCDRSTGTLSTENAMKA